MPYSLARMIQVAELAANGYKLADGSVYDGFLFPSENFGELLKYDMLLPLEYLPKAQLKLPELLPYYKV